MLAVTSAAEASRVLQLDPHTVAKLMDTAVLAGPAGKPGRRAGVYARSLETVAAILPATVAAGDIAIHLDVFGPDPDHHYGRAYAGWHQEKSLALPVSQRRQCWAGVWNMGRDNALAHVGHTAAATVGGFISKTPIRRVWPCTVAAVCPRSGGVRCGRGVLVTERQVHLPVRRVSLNLVRADRNHGRVSVNLVRDLAIPG